MKLTDVFDILPSLYNKPFSILKHEQDISGFTINKGNTGQFLQELLNIPNNSNLTDFEDGELKTNKADRAGNPLETMFITQISKDFDQLFFGDATNNRLIQKIANLLYLPVCKESEDPNNWFFLPAYHIDSTKDERLVEQFHKDFHQIKSKILNCLNNPNDGFIHTSNGEYIQIRSKDAKRKNGQYNPIFSPTLDRYVSNKNHAFYFKKNFMQSIQNGTIKATRIE